MSGGGGGGRTIAVRVNGRDREVPSGLTVHELLGHLELEPGLIVVERNREILDRERYEEIEVLEGDTLELVHFVGGG